MKRIAIGVLVGLAVGASNSSADRFDKLMFWAGKDRVARTPVKVSGAVAKSAVGSYFAPLLSVPKRPARWRVHDCTRGVCSFRVRGTLRCRGRLQVRQDPADYTVWLSRLRCR